MSQERVFEDGTKLRDDHWTQFNQLYGSQPHEVSIETQALCNARCTFCPYPTLERKGTKMSDEMLGKLMDEFAGFKLPFYFSPFKVNEPFLDKRLIPLCEEFNRRVPDGVLRLFSNGSALTDKHIEGVARLKRVRHLWISLNEINADAYEATMGLNFEITAKRLDSLHRAAVGWKFMHEVVVSRVGGSTEERQDFVLYVHDRWPKFKASIIKRDAWIDFTSPDDPEVPDTPCTRWWELNITADGIVRHCCMDDGADDRWIVGDLKTQTMLEVYNSPRWRDRREALVSRKQLDDTSPCARCSY